MSKAHAGTQREQSKTQTHLFSAALPETTEVGDMKHSDIHHQLYDYAMNALRDGERRNVDQHLSSCTSCAEDLRELQQAIALLPHPASSPSDERDEAFWAHLAMNVEREIRQSKAVKPNAFTQTVESIRSFFTLRPGYAYTIGGLFAMVVLATVVFRWQPTGKEQAADIQPVRNDSTILYANVRKNHERVGEYFRKSRMLLVGIANMNEHPRIDLSAERRVSRDLIHEARFIRMQPINNRTEKLVNDLEKVLIELANTEPETGLPEVELIRSGIHQENLLFKIRMAEASFETPRNSAKERIY